jgi:hypothetical protein
MPTVWIRVVPALLCACAFVFAGGCGEDTKGRVATIPVTGTVKVAGEPLKKGTITFVPVSGTNTASGEIQGGAYSLTTYSKGDGAPPGDYRVSISAWLKEPEMGKPAERAIAEKYFNAEASGLTATVSKQSQKIDFNLDRE